MADSITKFDVQNAVRDGLRDITNNMVGIKENIARVELRTNDLDQSQAEIKQLVRMAPMFEESIQKLRDIHTDADKIDKVVDEVATLKTLLQTNIQYLQQVSQYLGSLDAHLRENSGPKKV